MSLQKMSALRPQSTTGGAIRKAATRPRQGGAVSDTGSTFRDRSLLSGGPFYRGDRQNRQLGI